MKVCTFIYLHRYQLGHPTFKIDARLLDKLNYISQHNWLLILVGCIPDSNCNVFLDRVYTEQKHAVMVLITVHFENKQAKYGTGCN